MESCDPRVSVVMITYNRRAETLRTLARLTEPPEKPRIVVVDNASSDGTAAAVRSAANGWPARSHRFHYLRPWCATRDESQIPDSESIGGHIFPSGPSIRSVLPWLIIPKS